MKFSILAIAPLVVAAAAQPNPRFQHPHPPRHQPAHVDVVTDVVTTTHAAAMVYVNQGGHAVSTAYFHHPSPSTSTSDLWPETGWPETGWALTGAFTPLAPEPTASPSKTHHPHHKPHHTEGASSASTTSSGSSGSTGSPGSYGSSGSSGSSGASGNSTSAFGYGLSYSPYNNDGTCKSQDQVTADFGAFSGYGFIRSYGVDCNQATTILNAVQAKGMKMFAGIYDINNVAAETQELISAAKNDWDSIYAVTVGNEAVNNGVASVSQVVAAVNQARSMLRGAGYNGPVATVDTSAQVISNPALCEASDFAAANCHAFFNADLTPDQAGPWVLEQAQRIKQACGGKDTMITESGWPNQGDANGLAIPSPQNMATAIQSLRSSFSNNMVLFSAFNNLWETNTAGTFGTNQFWGIYGYAPS